MSELTLEKIRILAIFWQHAGTQFCKKWQFHFCFPQIMATMGHFFQKKPLVRFALPSLFLKFLLLYFLGSPKKKMLARTYWLNMMISEFFSSKSGNFSSFFPQKPSVFIYLLIYLLCISGTGFFCCCQKWRKLGLVGRPPLAPQDPSILPFSKGNIIKKRQKRPTWEALRITSVVTEQITE